MINKLLSIASCPFGMIPSNMPLFVYFSTDRLELLYKDFKALKSDDIKNVNLIGINNEDDAKDERR